MLQITESSELRLFPHFGIPGHRSVEDEPITDFTVSIDLICWDEEYDATECKTVGTLEGCIVPVYVHDKLYDLIGWADEESLGRCELVTSVWDGEEHDFYADLGIECCGNGLLCLETMKIQEEYRGHNIGLIAVRQIIEVLGQGLSVIVAKPHPLDASEMSDRQIQVACDKLRAYWSQIGFIDNPLFPDYIYIDRARRIPAAPALKV